MSDGVDTINITFSSNANNSRSIEILDYVMNISSADVIQPEHYTQSDNEILIYWDYYGAISYIF